MHIVILTTYILRWNFCVNIRIMHHSTIQLIVCLFVYFGCVCGGGGVLCCSFITYCKTIISEELLYTDVIPIVNCNLIVTDFGII